MLWVQSIAFLKESYATDFLKESVELFTSLENVDYNFLLVLHLSHKVIIKNFIKDKNERKRLLTMITKSVKKTDVETTAGLEKVLIDHKQTKNKHNDIKERYHALKTKNTDLKTENNDLKIENDALKTKLHESIK